MKIEHLKGKKCHLKIYAHSQNSNGIVEMMIDIINKIYNEKFKQFLHFLLGPTINYHTLWYTKVKKS